MRKNNIIFLRLEQLKNIIWIKGFNYTIVNGTYKFPFIISNSFKYFKVK